MGRRGPIELCFRHHRRIQCGAFNDDLEPTIAWTGDRWLVEDFTADVRELLEKEQLAGYEADVVPSLSAAFTACALAAAALWSGSRKSDAEE